MKKSLLDIIKEKTGKRVDVSDIDFSGALVERVQMNSKSFSKVVGDTDVLVGFEAEWNSGSFKSEWDTIGSTPDSCDLDEAREHSQWTERDFTERYHEWLDNRRDNFRDYNSSEIFDYASSNMLDDYESDCTDDDAVREITGMRSGEFEDAVRDYLSLEEDEEVDDDQKLEYLKDKYSSSMLDYIRENWSDEWNEYEDKYIERYSDDDSEDDYFEEERSDIIRWMGMDDDDSEITDDGMQELKNDIERKTGVDIVGVSTDYDGTDKREEGYRGYYLETDSGDIELISPPQPIDKTLEDLEKILDFIGDDGESGRGNGLHVSLSIAGKTAADYDPLKILMFLGEDHLLKTFGREQNSFTKSHKSSIMGTKALLDALFVLGDFDPNTEEVGNVDPAKLVQAVLSGGTDKTKYTHFINLLVKNMWGDRYRSFNLKHLYNSVDEHSVEGVSRQFADTPYIEFRIMGNQGYEGKYATIKDTILRYGYVMRLATDATAEREEYAKKLYRFFSALIQASDQINDVAPPISAVNKKLVTDFSTKFRRDYMSGRLVFALGKRRMQPEVALGYMSRILTGQIEQWMHDKAYETWMIIALIISKADYDQLNINIKDYTQALRVIAQRMRLSSKHRFGLVADGALIADEYRVGIETYNESEFKEYIMRRAAELDIIN